MPGHDASHDASASPVVLRRSILAPGSVPLELPLRSRYMLLGPLLATLVASLAAAHLLVPNRLRSVNRAIGSG